MARQHRKPIEKADSSGQTAKERQGKVESMSQHTETITPIIVEAGKCSKKSIRQLKEGTGKLMQEVSDIVHEIRSDPATATTGMVPIVIVYREKEKAGLKIPLLPTPLNIFK
jgi:hypothetical protein